MVKRAINLGNDILCKMLLQVNSDCPNVAGVVWVDGRDGGCTRAGSSLHLKSCEDIHE